jgi:hypothetical protein
MCPMHVPQSHDTCAASAADDRLEEPGVVAATQAAGGRRSKGHKRPP